jgi:hypothetical protein
VVKFAFGQMDTCNNDERERERKREAKMTLIVMNQLENIKGMSSQK